MALNRFSNCWRARRRLVAGDGRRFTGVARTCMSGPRSCHLATVWHGERSGGINGRCGSPETGHRRAREAEVGSALLLVQLRAPEDGAPGGEAMRCCAEGRRGSGRGRGGREVGRRRRPVGFRLMAAGKEQFSRTKLHGMGSGYANSFARTFTSFQKQKWNTNSPKSGESAVASRWHETEESSDSLGLGGGETEWQHDGGLP